MSQELKTFREHLDEASELSGIKVFSAVGFVGLVAAVTDHLLNVGKTRIHPVDELSSWQRSFRYGMGIGFVTMAEFALAVTTLKFFFPKKEEPEPEHKPVKLARTKQAVKPEVDFKAFECRQNWREKLAEEKKQDKATALSTLGIVQG
ncbi:MAG: hypothetical protein H6573_34470 [Lewinellaceae bacterium]|nr:hypothetical protein [Lewinellaceae bacterium]